MSHTKCLRNVVNDLFGDIFLEQLEYSAIISGW